MNDEVNESGKVYCNDTLKDVKNCFAYIRNIHKITETARIKLWWVNELNQKHPEIQEQIIADMFKRLGISIQEAAKKSKAFVELETAKFGDDQLLELSTIVISQLELFNHLKAIYQDGYRNGFESGQAFNMSEQINRSIKENKKDQYMLVMNEPKTCVEKNCGMKFYYIKNQETSKFIPVDVDSLSEDDIQKLQRFDTVYYDKTRHVSHFKTCKNPNRFSRKSK